MRARREKHTCACDNRSRAHARNNTRTTDYIFFCKRPRKVHQTDLRWSEVCIVPKRSFFSNPTSRVKMSGLCTNQQRTTPFWIVCPAYFAHAHERYESSSEGPIMKKETCIIQISFLHLYSKWCIRKTK